MTALTVCTTVHTGDAVLPQLDDLAALRCAVFRDWPYLYEGDPAYEADYLRVYAQTPDAAVVIARHGGRTVGASTCVPLAAEGPAVRAPFERAGVDPASTFYFGESVLLPDYRGQGIGVRFFEAREARARACGAARAAFCAVRRAADDPRRPACAVPLDAFWRKRGFAPAGFACEMVWRELGASVETPHALDVWIKTF